MSHKVGGSCGPSGIDYNLGVSGSSYATPQSPKGIVSDDDDISVYENESDNEQEFVASSCCQKLCYPFNLLLECLKSLGEWVLSFFVETDVLPPYLHLFKEKGALILSEIQKTLEKQSLPTTNGVLVFCIHKNDDSMFGSFEKCPDLNSKEIFNSFIKNAKKIDSEEIDPTKAYYKFYYFYPDSHNQVQCIRSYPLNHLNIEKCLYESISWSSVEQHEKIPLFTAAVEALGVQELSEEEAEVTGGSSGGSCAEVAGHREKVTLDQVLTEAQKELLNAELKKPYGKLFIGKGYQFLRDVYGLTHHPLNQKGILVFSEMNNHEDYNFFGFQSFESSNTAETLIALRNQFNQFCEDHNLDGDQLPFRCFYFYQSPYEQRIKYIQSSYNLNPQVSFTGRNPTLIDMMNVMRTFNPETDLQDLGCKGDNIELFNQAISEISKKDNEE